MQNVEKSREERGSCNSNQSYAHDHNTKNIAVAFFLNLGFSLIEIIGGILTNSIAIISDAVHDIGDSVSLGIAWYLQKLSRKGRDRKFSYGYRRFSLLAAVFISVVLLVSSVFIIQAAVLRLANPEQPDAQGMLWLSIVGIVVNGIAVLRMRKSDSLSERAVFLHLMEDVMGWVAVLAVSIVMMFVELPILDPLLSIGISVWVLWNAFRNLKKTFTVLLQGTPNNIDIDSMCADIIRQDHIISLHDLHLWSLDGDDNITTMHVVIDNQSLLQDEFRIKEGIRAICSQYHVAHATIELEREGDPDCEYNDNCWL